MSLYPLFPSLIPTCHTSHAFATPSRECLFTPLFPSLIPICHTFPCFCHTFPWMSLLDLSQRRRRRSSPSASCGGVAQRRSVASRVGGTFSDRSRRTRGRGAPPLSSSPTRSTGSRTQRSRCCFCLSPSQPSPYVTRPFFPETSPAPFFGLEQRQTFLHYYLPAYYFSMLLLAKVQGVRHPPCTHTPLYTPPLYSPPL